MQKTGDLAYQGMQRIADDLDGKVLFIGDTEIPYKYDEDYIVLIKVSKEKFEDKKHGTLHICFGNSERAPLIAAKCYAEHIDILYKKSGKNLIHNYYKYVQFLKQFIDLYYILFYCGVIISGIALIDLVFQLINEFSIKMLFIGVIIMCFPLILCIIASFYYPYLKVRKKLVYENIENVTLKTYKVKKKILTPLERYVTYVGYTVYGIDQNNKKRKLFYPILDKKFKKINLESQVNYKIIDNLIIRG
mgnify:CR=1 FL=1